MLEETIAALEAKLKTTQSGRAADKGRKILLALKQRQRQLNWAVADAEKYLARPDHAYRAVPEPVKQWIAARTVLDGVGCPSKIRQAYMAETGAHVTRGDFYYGLLAAGAPDRGNGTVGCRLK
jgi:hypothetical protein